MVLLPTAKRYDSMYKIKIKIEALDLAVSVVLIRAPESFDKPLSAAQDLAVQQS